MSGEKGPARSGSLRERFARGGRQGGSCSSTLVRRPCVRPPGWDNRCCWLRDASFRRARPHSRSAVETMNDLLHWLHNVARDASGGHIQPRYGTGLEKALPETSRDPRFVHTVEALEASLCEGRLYIRRHAVADAFGKLDTAFGICAFWRIDALACTGWREQARAIFAAMLAARNPLGLLSEDTEPRTGELWGNFPQTYPMVGVINAAVRPSAPWDSVI